MNPETFFPTSYTQARNNFLSACSNVDADISSYEHERIKGVDGENLYVDVALIGDHKAERLFVIGSGTHGVEGFCGSACQFGLLSESLYKQLPEGTALLMVHALNPHGFSHCRRVNEDNVDINRNFVNPGNFPATSKHYEELHPYVVPKSWFGPEREKADAKINEFIETHGERAYQAAITGGQYTHNDGLFYGGREPVWSNLTWQNIIKQHMGRAQSVLFIDVHTGVGPYGYGEPIFIDSSLDQGYELALSWFGEDLTNMHGEDCISAVVEGPISNGMRWVIPDSRFTIISLEYGTRPVPQAIDALRADNWLHLHEHEVTEEQHKLIKAQIRDAFYVEESKWKSMIWERFVELFGRAADNIGKV